MDEFVHSRFSEKGGTPKKDTGKCIHQVREMKIKNVQNIKLEVLESALFMCKPTKIYRSNSGMQSNILIDILSSVYACILMLQMHIGQPS